MTRITFLHGASDRLQAAIAWLGTAAREGRRGVVFAPSDRDLAQLDHLLWTQPATGFTPHCKSDSALAAETPVVLASSIEQPMHSEFLVNLSEGIPPGFSSFEHLVEIIGTAEADRIAGRERYRFYRERGYPLEAMDISGDAA